MLFQADAGAGTAAGMSLEQTGGAQYQVAVVGGHVGLVTFQAQGVCRGKVQDVTLVEQGEQGLQFMVAVRPTAGNMQKQVQFARGRKGEHGHFSAPGCQSLINRVKRLPFCRALMR